MEYTCESLLHTMAITSRRVCIGDIHVITICMNYGVSNADACVITTAAAIKLFAFLTP
jgi:hypothetical protein